MVQNVKAKVLVDAKKFVTQYFPYPKDLPKDAAIVKIQMAGICGSDQHFYSGRPPIPPYPAILGHENIGIIQEIGDTARNEMEVNGKILTEGDRIIWSGSTCGKCWYCNNVPQRTLCLNSDPEIRAPFGWMVSCKDPPHLFGGYAEYGYLRPRTRVYKVPEDLPSEIAVLTDIMASVNGIARYNMPWPYLKEGLDIDDTVVIQGAGPIGLMGAVRSKVIGAGNVIMTGAPEHRLKMAEDFGVDFTINIEEVTDPKKRIEKVQELTNNIGADLVVECTGVPSAVQEGIEMVRRGGTYILIGCLFDRGPVPLNPWRLVAKDIRLFGQSSGHKMEYWKSMNILHKYRDMFPFEKVVTHKFPLDEVEKAMSVCMNLEGMKVLLIP